MLAWTKKKVSDSCVHKYVQKWSLEPGVMAQVYKPKTVMENKTLTL